MKKNIISIIQAVAAFVAIIALATILRPCNSDMKMNCEKSVRIVMILFAIIGVIHLIFAFLKYKEIAVNVLTIVILIGTILIPSNIIGGCKMADMACHSVSFPGIYTISSILIAVNVILVIISFVKKKDTVQ